MSVLTLEKPPTPDAPPLLRILLVEDDEFDVAVFRRTFRKSGIPCEIIRCWRAEDVLEGLGDASVPIDLLVADHQLPGMSGLDLCLELLAEKPPFALVLLTGGGSEQVAIQAIKAGVHDYIVKDSRQDYLKLLPLILPQAAERHRDYLARKKVETELRHSREAALEASRVRSRFLGELSHDIRAALDGVRGATANSLETALAAEQRRHLEHVRAEAEHAAVLVDRILEIADLETQHVDLQRIPLSLSELIDQTLQSAAPAAEAKALELAYEVAGDVSDAVLGDPLRLRQILANLVDNAVAYTDRGEVRLRLSKPAGDTARDLVQFSVTDTGIGIPPQDRERIFEAFTPSRSGGPGLGLAMSAHLVQLMGGRIWVESEEGRGSIFHFTATLPADPAAPERGGARSRSTASVLRNSRRAASYTGWDLPIAPSGETQKRVLLAQPNPLVAFVATRVLEKLGCPYVAVENGRQAVEALAREPFDIVMLDAKMPQVDGCEATRLLRQHEAEDGRPLHIVGIVADAEEAERCRAAGMDATAAKPVDLDGLKAVMKRVLGR